jgi:NAD(P)-dependent dehydrogenase (short-subunit alcohol dehydrogenase family)
MTPQRFKQVNKSACRVALVTGAALRPGRAISLELARAGFDVAINYHRSAAAP